MADHRIVAADGMFGLGEIPESEQGQYRRQKARQPEPAVTEGQGYRDERDQNADDQRGETAQSQRHIRNLSERGRLSPRSFEPV
jgi:hypothetical protein